MGTATCYILHALYGTLIICLRTSHFLQEFEQVGRLNSYRDKQVVHVQCRLSVSYLRAKLLLSGSQRILFFSEKDRSLKRFYGKLILAVSDRARWAPLRARFLVAMICCDPTALVTLPDNDAYHLLKGES